MKYQLKVNNTDRYKDLNQMDVWSNKTLIENYSEKLKERSKLEKKVRESSDKNLVSQLNQLNDELETIRNEGNRRDILDFKTWDEVKEICERIFAVKPKYKLTEGVHPTSVAYKDD